MSEAEDATKVSVSKTETSSPPNLFPNPDNNARDMKGLITAFFLLLGICPATEVAAQRDLHRQLSLYMQAGTVDGLSVCSRYGEYAWGTAIALERTNRNRTHWKFGVEYLHRDFRYGPQCIPQRQYLAGVGYYVHLLHDRGYHVRVSAGGALLVGYETVGGRSRTLYDGARLVNGDAVLWGGALSAELSAFLSDRVALSLEVAQRITAGSSVTLFRTTVSVGIRFIIN